MALPIVRSVDCLNVCLQAEAYGVWPEHRCDPTCAFLPKPVSPSVSLFTTIGEGPASRRSIPEPDTFYGFFYTDCIYESAYALVSLHRTKRGAWEACRKAQWDRWIEHLDGQQSGMHLRHKGEPRRGGHFDYHIYRQSDDYRVRPIKVTD